MNDPVTVEFFGKGKREVILLDVKPKLNSEKEKRIRFDFAMKLTATTLESAPENVKEAFYTVSKELLGLNPVGITSEFQDAVINFYATAKTAHPSLEVSGCTIRQLSVVRPEKQDLQDGDVRLKFHINVPASREVWLWAYSNYGAELAAEFEELQPLLPHIRGVKDEVAPPDNQEQLPLNNAAVESEADSKPVKKKSNGKKPAKKKK